MVGLLAGTPARLELAEVHRFEHLSCPTPTGPVWDVTGIWQNILQGLQAATAWCNDRGVELRSVGVDTWGVDWVLVGACGELLGLPHCYRDPQNEAACQLVLDRLGGFEKLYSRTGIQLMEFNTLFQLAARFEQEPRLFNAAERLLFLPDLFHYWLSGEMATELSIASTSSMLDVTTGRWDTELLELLGLPTPILGAIVEPATQLGTLREELVAATGAPIGLQVIAPAAHDTASAVAAVPAQAETQWAYLSSGTWSLLGAELDKPIATDAARQAAFTNERGVGGTVRFLKNIAGLWLVQELRRDLRRQGQSLSFAELVEQAEPAEAGRTLVDPNSAEFAAPGEMIAKLQQFARRTHQPLPDNPGQLVRCCLESLAFCYAESFGRLETVLGRSLDVLHLVGGGIQNQLLNRFTCDALQKPVVTGPVEATAIGNILVQAIGCGAVSDRVQAREIVARSFVPQVLGPASDKSTESLRERYQEIISSN